MSNILHVCNSFDPAGDVTRCVRELQSFSKHRHEVIIKDRHPFQDKFQYEEPLYIGDRIPKEVFFPNDFDAVIYHFVGPEQGYSGFSGPKGFRNATAYYNGKKDKFYATYDTTAKDMSKFNLIGTNHLGAKDFLAGNIYAGIDNQLVASQRDVHFLPSLIPLDHPLYQPNWDIRKACVSMIKNPEMFYNANYKGNPARQYLYGKSHAEIMDARRDYASIVIDNTSDGHYGLAGLEAMALGLPTVVFNHRETQLQLSMITGIVPPGMVEVPFAGDVSEAVNENMNYCVLKRKAVREWMDLYYNSSRLINRFWDPFVDQLLESACT